MPTLRAAALPAALALAALLAPASAHAGTVSAGMALAFAAGPGEANRVTVSRSADRIVFTDALPIAESALACDGNGTTVVSCAAAPAPAAVTVDLGDLDDRLTVGALGGAIRAEGAGGAGIDRLDAAAATGYVALDGGAGGDALVAGTGESDLTGGEGDDVLTGGPDGASTTYLMGATADGADQLLGGAGLDVAGYAQRTVPLHLTADDGADDGAAGEGDRIGRAVERLEGGSAPDVLAASPLVDGELSGGGGNDTLAGGPRADLLSGGEGDDVLTGGAGDDVAAPSDGDPVDSGADSFAGNEGFDTLSYATRSAPVSASLDGVANDGEANERDSAGADVEALVGGRGADILTGSARPESITGGSGDDTIDPGAGVDEVRAGDGSDTVRAQDANAEWISCGLGTDRLTADFEDVPVACESIALAPPRDTRKPRVKLDSLPARPRYRHVRRGLRPRLTADEPVSYVVELLGVARSAHISASPYNLTLARRTIPRTSRPRRVTLKPKAALLGPRRRLRVRIRVTATDVAGNVRIVRRTLKARR
jgi:Ca2+-binding RTX toxin-like protein